MNSTDESTGSDYEIEDYDDDYVLLTDTYLKVVDTREHGGLSPYFTNSLPYIKEEEEYELCDSARSDAKSFLKDESSTDLHQTYKKPIICTTDSNHHATEHSNKSSDLVMWSTVQVKSNGDKSETYMRENSLESLKTISQDLPKIENISTASANQSISDVEPMNVTQKSTYRMESLNVKPIIPKASLTAADRIPHRNNGQSSSFKESQDRSNNHLSFNPRSVDIKQHVMTFSPLNVHDSPNNGSGDVCKSRTNRANYSLEFNEGLEDYWKEASLLMPSSCIDFVDSVIDSNRNEHERVPIQICRLRDKFKYIYSQYFNQGLDPTPWLQFLDKPKVSSLVEGRVRRILCSSHLVGLPVTAMDLKPQIGKHLVLKGEAGSGKSTWLRRFAYQYGLSLLPYIDEEFDLVLYIQGDMFPVEFSSDFLDLSEFLTIMLPEDCCECEFKSFCINWMLQNSKKMLFLIDTSFQTFLFVQQLIKKEIFPESTSIFTNSPLFDHLISFMKMEINYEMVPWSESDILKYLRHFSQAFRSENEKMAFLECVEGLNCSRLLSLPDNCSLICLLYYLNKHLLQRVSIANRTDILDILFLHFIQQRFPDIQPNNKVDFPEGVTKILESAWSLLLKMTDEDVSIPLAEICDSDVSTHEIDNRISLSGWEFGDYLASKFICLQYEMSTLKDINKFPRHIFHKCWTVIEQNITSKTTNHICKLPVFLCGLLKIDCKCLFESIPEHFKLLAPVPRTRLNKILEDCASEISPALPEYAEHIRKMKLLDAAQSSPIFTKGTGFVFNDAELKRSQFYEKEINFKEVCKDSNDPNSAISKQIFQIKNCSRIDSLTLIFHIDELSLDNIKDACLCFHIALNTLYSLNIALYFKSPDQMNAQANIQKISHVIKTFNEFLHRNQDLKSLGLWGGFLLPNTLSNLKEHILLHPALESLSVKGQLEINNQRCLGRFDPYSGIVLSMILGKRHWKYVCVDLRGFSSDSKSSLNMNRLVRVISNHNLDERLKGFPLRAMDMEPNLDQMHVASTSELNNIQTASQAEQNLLSHIIQPLKYHLTVESISLRCKSVGTALLDNLSDMIDVCFRLKCLELEVEYIDEEFILSVGSGIVCANNIEYCTVIGKVFRRYASNAGKCITGLLQSCIQSNSLRGILIKISPLYEEDIDWLLISIPSLPNIPQISVKVVIESKVITIDPENFSEKLKYLKYKTTHRNLDLDCRISAILESSF